MIPSTVICPEITKLQFECEANGVFDLGHRGSG